MQNVTLVGMPGSGKSTIGVLLAKRLGFSFMDVDLVIQQQESRLLKEIIAQEGLDGFLKIEDRINSQIIAKRTVIAPGGSVIYGEQAMNHLKDIGLIVYLRISYESLLERLGDLTDRGVALKDGMTIRDLYQERVPLYEQYADIIIDENGKTPGMIVDELRKILEEQFQ